MTFRTVLDTWAPLASVLGSLLLGGAAWLTAGTGRRLGVSGREGEARRDTIADRDALYTAAIRDRDGWRDRALASEAREQRWLDAAQAHVPWDWLAQQITHEAGKPLPPPPPLRPEREDDPT